MSVLVLFNWSRLIWDLESNYFFKVIYPKLNGNPLYIDVVIILNISNPHKYLIF